MHAAVERQQATVRVDLCRRERGSLGGREDAGREGKQKGGEPVAITLHVDRTASSGRTTTKIMEITEMMTKQLQLLRQLVLHQNQRQTARLQKASHLFSVAHHRPRRSLGRLHAHFEHVRGVREPRADDAGSSTARKLLPDRRRLRIFFSQDSCEEDEEEQAEKKRPSKSNDGVQKEGGV